MGPAFLLYALRRPCKLFGFMVNLLLGWPCGLSAKALRRLAAGRDVAP